MSLPAKPYLVNGGHDGGERLCSRSGGASRWNIPPDLRQKELASSDRQLEQVALVAAPRRRERRVKRG